jgi:hypothetical protein
MIVDIKGDGSYLGIVDVGSYKGFVGKDWAKNPRLLEPHFIQQMCTYSGLFWDTNLESAWRVEVSMERSDKTGYREVQGSLVVTGGKLVILDYDALTMMAQFEEHTLERYVGDNAIVLENGNYDVRIVQVFDPKVHFSDGKSADFLIEVTKTNELGAAWGQVPWSKLK